MTNVLKSALSLDELLLDDLTPGDRAATAASAADIVGLPLDRDFWQRGYRMTSAEIQVEHPNAPGVMRTMVWQDLDQAPDYPVLTAFLDDWVKTRDERVVAIRVVTVQDLTPDRLALHGISVAAH